MRDRTCMIHATVRDRTPATSPPPLRECSVLTGYISYSWVSPSEIQILSMRIGRTPSLTRYENENGVLTCIEVWQVAVNRAIRRVEFICQDSPTEIFQGTLFRGIPLLSGIFSGMFQWISRGMFQRNFTCQWYFPTACHLSSGCWIVQWIFSGIFQWIFTCQGKGLAVSSQWLGIGSGCLMCIYIYIYIYVYTHV